MAATSLVQARLDPQVKAKAARILKKQGLTVSDAVRILLTRTAAEGSMPLQPTPEQIAYDVWFRQQVQEALDDPRPLVPHAEAKARFAKRKAELLARA